MGTRDNWFAEPSLLIPADGLYTPTGVAVANVAVVTPNQCMFFRIGRRTVHVAGSVVIDPTAASVLTQITLTIPITAAFANAQQASGVASRGGAAPIACGILASAGAGTVLLSYLNDTDTASRTWSFEFTYYIP